MVTPIGRVLRRTRRARDLSLRELATIAEVSPSLLSQIENSKVNPSVATLYAIAAALSLPPSHFFDHHGTDGSIEQALLATPVVPHASDRAEPAGQEGSTMPSADTSRTGAAPPSTGGGKPHPIVRAETRARIELSEGVAWDRLTPSDEAGVEFLEITYPVGATSGEKLSRHSGREYGLVLQGTLTVELGFQTYTISQGDSIAFDSSTPHRLVNLSESSARAVWVVVRQ
jgi:transcriptional regulator with XRE-family HTH domain/quercetin dioxygenase-like cupin family protein